MTTSEEMHARENALRFAGCVHDETNVDLGTNRDGERVVRLDLTYRRGCGASVTELVLALDAARALRNQLDGLFAAAGLDDEPEPTVAEEDACPRCGERHQDQLVWVADGAAVKCQHCGEVFTPRFR